MYFSFLKANRDYNNLFIYILFALFSVFPVTLYAEETSSIDIQLAHADKIRSSNPKLFKKIISQLNIQQIQLSLPQKHYLKYLNGYHASLSDKPNRAIEIFNEILSSNADNKIKFRTNLSLVNVLAVSKNWIAAMPKLNKLLNQLPQIDDQSLVNMAYFIATITYDLYDQYPLVIKYAKKLPFDQLNVRDKCFVSFTTTKSKLALHQIKLNNIKEEETFKICKNANEDIMSNLLRTYIARLHNNKNAPAKALAILVPYVKEIEAINYPRLSIEVYAASAHAYLLQHNLERAQTFALKVIKNSKGLETTEPVSQAYLSLFKIAEQNKNYSLALEYHKKYLATEKAYTDENSAKELAFQIAQHQSLEQQSQIKLLDKQNKLLNIEQQINKSELANNRLFMSLLSIIVVLLAFFGFRSYQMQKQLKALSEFDPLTGVYNRGHFTHLAKTALAYAKNTKQDLCVVMFDLDYFKSINDSYGHACGDWALKEVVTAIQMVIRQEDIFARIGGEEFCLILPNCDLPSSIMVVEQYRRVLTEIDSIASGQQFSISASFGITDVENSGYQLEQLLADADTAMYKSKENGRNRVTLFNTF